MDLASFIKFAENYLWMYAHHVEHCYSDVNPDVHLIECPILNAENLGALLHRKRAKYHRTCRIRYSNAKVDRYRKLQVPKPHSKAAKRSRHVSAHDNVEEALKNAAMETVRGLIMDQEKISPGLYPVLDLQREYNDYVTTHLPTDHDPSVDASLLSDHVTRFSERIQNAIPELRSFVINKKMYVCYDDRIVAGLMATLQQDNDEYDVMRTKLSRKIREDLASYSNTFKGRYDASILANKPSPYLRALLSEILDGDPESVTSEANTLADIVQHNYRTIKSSRKVSSLIYEKIDALRMCAVLSTHKCVNYINK